MAAGITDLLTRVTDSTTGRPIITSLASGKALAAASISLSAATNWTTTTAVHITIYNTTTAGGLTVKDTTTQTDWKGTLSGTTISNLTLTGGTDRTYLAGAVVELTPTARYAKDLYEWGITHADQDGTLKAGAVDNAAVLASDVVTTAKILNANVTPAKWTNPYKFSIYRNAALTATTGAWTLLTFDTVSFDSNSNVTIGSGRYTAPVAGFYQFNANVTIASNSTTVLGLSFYKNGSQISQPYLLNFTSANASTSMPGTVFLQLAASDYIQVYYYSNGAGAFSTGAVFNSFQGFLVSQT